MALSDSELRERVRELEGETVYTIQQSEPNRISRVTAERIIMAILARAVPEEIAAIKRSKIERLSGIRIRT